MGSSRVYFNTSLLIRAVNPREPGYRKALSFIEEMSQRKFSLIASSLLFYEGLRPQTLRSIEELLRRYKFTVKRVNIRKYLRRADTWIQRHGYSYSRILDVAHMMMARDLGCKYIAALDRFIWKHAKEFNLIYINYYTGVPKE